MGELRVIGGKAGGLRLKTVPGNSTRPITDRVKEALFNILGADIHHATLLDIFAGTGAVGIEALSRGADFVRMLDLNRLAIQVIRQNLEHTHFTDSAEVIQTDALAYIQRIPDKTFDYIYVAPPQYKQMWLDALNKFDLQPDWLAVDGWLIVQIHPVEYEAVKLSNFQEFEHRKYGSTMLVFFERKNLNDKSL